jgi:hypothetical protein
VPLIRKTAATTTPGKFEDASSAELQRASG